MCSACMHTHVYSVYVPEHDGYLMQGGLTAFFYATQNSHIETMRVMVNEFNCSPDTRGDVSDKLV